MSTDVLPLHDRLAPVEPLGLGALLAGARRTEVRARGSMATVDALLIFDFGAGSDAGPSRSNRQLADMAARWPDLPVLAQTEVATALARTGRVALDLQADLTTTVGEGYVDTTQVAGAAVRLLRSAGWHRVGVLAHPSHLLRCIATVERLGIEVSTPEISLSEVDFDPASTQWWTTSASAWRRRELAVVLHHRLTGRC